MADVYPLWLEKLVFLGLVIGAGFTAVLLEGYVSGVALYSSWFCGLPIAVLFMTEAAGRILQSFHTK
jgi:hypothetical protein